MRRVSSLATPSWLSWSSGPTSTQCYPPGQVTDQPIKIPPKGTRGVPFPRFIARLTSGLTAGMFRRRPNKTGGGIQTLLLETRGAKTGKARYAILGYLEDGPMAWLVVASVAGASRHPGWLYNLEKDPHATIEFFGGRRVEVEAETLAGAELDAAWKRLEVEAPEYPKYLSKTDKEIPIIRLTQR
jgi:deazaflavin-dependent oxidoreductase (nitroreductase family)